MQEILPSPDRRRLVRLVLCVVMAVCPLYAQSADQIARQHRLFTDWAGLTRYGSENTEVKPPKPSEERVIFLGDQITENWGSEDNGPFFAGKPYLNRGIRDQTTAQMLVRFRQDVIEL